MDQTPQSSNVFGGAYRLSMPSSPPALGPASDTRNSLSGDSQRVISPVRMRNTSPSGLGLRGNVARAGEAQQSGGGAVGHFSRNTHASQGPQSQAHISSSSSSSSAAAAASVVNLDHQARAYAASAPAPSSSARVSMAGQQPSHFTPYNSHLILHISKHVASILILQPISLMHCHNCLMILTHLSPAPPLPRLPSPTEIAPLSYRAPAPHASQTPPVSIRPPLLNAASTSPSVHTIYQQQQQRRQLQEQQQHQQKQQQQTVVAKDLAAALDQEMHLMSMQRLAVLQEQIKQQQETIRQLKVGDVL
jgi:hypothetical protein